MVRRHGPLFFVFVIAVLTNAGLDCTDLSGPITKQLRRQLRWWLHTLSSRAYSPSPIWFRDEQQHSALIQSDASGDQGFGFCARASAGPSC